MDTVYDATVVTCANGDLAGRRRGNALDRRLRVLEEFVNGRRVAWYNNKLLQEYENHVVERRNDVIETFLDSLADHGRRATSNRLSTSQYASARRMRWPSHDQHLLAAALEATRATIFTTERRLHSCRADVQRVFGVAVIRL